MAKFYLLGGENLHRKDAKDINAVAFEDAGGAPNVLVFPWAKPSFDNRYARRRKLFDYFRSLGAEEVKYAEYSQSQEELAEEISRADLVYLSGGQASILITRLKAQGVEGMLRNFRGIVVGRSAGALALAAKCIVKDRYSGTTRTADGLGFVDVCVKAHYQRVQDAMLKVLSKRERIFAIPQASALTCYNGVLSVLGDVFIFENGEKHLFLKKS